MHAAKITLTALLVFSLRASATSTIAWTIHGSMAGLMVALDATMSGA